MLKACQNEKTTWLSVVFTDTEAEVGSAENLNKKSEQKNKHSKQQKGPTGQEYRCTHHLSTKKTYDTDTFRRSQEGKQSAYARKANGIP